MICKQCGREVPDRAIYCRYCGARLGDKEARQASDLMPERPKRRGPAIIAAVLVLALLAGLTYWLLNRGRNAEPAPAPQEPAAVEPAQPEPSAAQPAEPVEYTLRIEGDDNIEAGKDVVLNAVVEPEAEIKRMVWTSSTDSATVVDGIVTGERAGETIIRCLAALEDGPVLEAELPFRVLPKPVRYTLSFDPEQLELTAGSAGTFTLVVETDPEGEPAEAQTEWESSDTLVAAVTDGRVQAVGVGSATITARVTLPDGSKQTVQGEVKVTAAQANPTPSAPQVSAQQPAAAPAPAPAPAPTPAPVPSKPTFEPEGEAPVKTEDYLMSNSDSAYLSVDALLKLSDEELRLGRNEIFARHGRQFATDWIRQYFEGKSWYQGTIAPDDFDVSVLNAYERENVSRIVYAEEHN